MGVHADTNTVSAAGSMPGKWLGALRVRARGASAGSPRVDAPEGEAAAVRASQATAHCAAKPSARRGPGRRERGYRDRARVGPGAAALTPSAPVLREERERDHAGAPEVAAVRAQRGRGVAAARVQQAGRHDRAHARHGLLMLVAHHALHAPPERAHLRARGVAGQRWTETLRADGDKDKTCCRQCEDATQTRARIRRRWCVHAAVGRQLVHLGRWR